MKATRIFRWLLIILVGAFVIIQFIRPSRANPPVDPARTIESQLQVPQPVTAIMDRSCNDCHSNKTVWPWYTNVAPVSWFIANHVNEARRDMNFSQWADYDKDKQSRRLRDICEQVSDGEMPLSTYTPLHAGSKLSGDQVKVLCDWANAERDRLRNSQ
ncbi:MAG TPA: heme-binding domain-containing protein [Pyrinomonadaceae bacterium]|nr:heme-binding domain-containing protein [Pyrinomonadaceae bacterium]